MCCQKPAPASRSLCATNHEGMLAGFSGCCERGDICGTAGQHKWASMSVKPLDKCENLKCFRAAHAFLAQLLSRKSLGKFQGCT